MEATYKAPKTLIDTPTHYCPGCGHGIVHRLIAEIIDDGNNGFVVEYPVNIKEIADKINMLSDEQKRLNIGKKARENALKYSVKSNAQKTLQLYKEICEV